MLIKIEKLIGAPRGTRNYKIENQGKFKPSFDFTIEDGVINFAADNEKLFKEEIEKYIEIQKAELAEELRDAHHPQVEDITSNQGTKEWVISRAGSITASNPPFTVDGLPIHTFDAFVYSSAAGKIAVDRGIERASIITEAMSIGSEVEHIAREKFIEQTGLTVAEKGFIKAKNLPAGCSPDGVVVDEDFNKFNLEIKSPMLEGYIAELAGEEQSKKYKAQLQLQMYLLDVDMTYFVVQCQEDTTLPIIIREINRDEWYIKNMIETIKLFEQKFDDVMKKFNDAL